MSLRLLKHLSEVQHAITLLRQFTAGRSFDDYLGDAMLRAAVERQFEIIGEALNRAAEIDRQLDRKVSGLARIIGFRNLLSHGYDIVDHEIVWAALGKLDQLEAEVESILYP